MKKLLPAILLAGFLSVGCLLPPGHRGYASREVPPLPAVVVLEEEPYYHQGAYYYYYQGGRWSYSSSRSGPWVELPRGHYPKEVKYKGKGDDKGKHDDNGRGEKRGHDKNKW